MNLRAKRFDMEEKMREETTENRHMITVRPQVSRFAEDVDEYAAGLPLTIRETMREALYREYEGNYEQEEALCREMLEKLPDHQDVLSLLGRCLLSQRKYNEAQEIYEHMLETGKADEVDRISLGIVYHAKEDYRKAVEQLEAVGTPSEYHPFFYSTLGDSYQKIGKEHKARDTFRAEVTRYEETREIQSPENLDGCFCCLIYLDARLTMLTELKVDMAVYKRFLEKTEMTPTMKKHLAGNISYWSTLLTMQSFREPFVDFVREVESAGYLLDSEYLYIIENAYRSAESYRYHEDSRIDSFMESFLSACSRADAGGKDDASLATALSYQWYLTKCFEEYTDDFLYVAEQYPHSYARAVTFLDQLATFGPVKTREMILDRLIRQEQVKVGREDLAAGLDQAYLRARSAKKEPVYLAEGNTVYRRGGKKILPNDPCPCGSGRKYKKCHGRNL